MGQKTPQRREKAPKEKQTAKESQIRNQAPRQAHRPRQNLRFSWPASGSTARNSRRSSIRLHQGLFPGARQRLAVTQGAAKEEQRSKNSQEGVDHKIPHGRLLKDNDRRSPFVDKTPRKGRSKTLNPNKKMARFSLFCNRRGAKPKGSAIDATNAPGLEKKPRRGKMRSWRDAAIFAAKCVYFAPNGAETNDWSDSVAETGKKSREEWLNEEELRAWIVANTQGRRDPEAPISWIESDDGAPELLCALFKDPDLSARQRIALLEILRDEQGLCKEPPCPEGIAQLSVGEIDHWDPTALAARFRRPECVLWMIDNGAGNANCESPQGVPLSLLCPVELCIPLLDRGAKPGETLHWLCDNAWSAETEKAAVRLAQETDVIERRDINGHTPLHRAAKRGDLGAIQWLLGQGADLEARDRRHRLPVDLADERKRPQAAAFLRQTALARREHAELAAQNDAIKNEEIQEMARLGRWVAQLAQEGRLQIDGKAATSSELAEKATAKDENARLAAKTPAKRV